ncbi:unnamed protein product [Thelazia callipaeda]|uniref:C2H2-type domain-containing protein n=1 Tax=Thelazia callipaeda TaxID=103827 RepID=A0A0N5D6L3_THECL|nr:unnamed protein product [Thelazia callipaeda]
MKCLKMMPASLNNGNGTAKHHQQLLQSASMIPSPYNFLPSVFANAQLDMQLFRPPDSNLGAMYLSQLAATAAINQSQNNGSNEATSSNSNDQQQDESSGESIQIDIPASTSSEVVTSSCRDESPLSHKSSDITEQEVEGPREQDSSDDDTLSQNKVNAEDAGVLDRNDDVQVPQVSELQQVDLSKWISEFLPSVQNNPLGMAGLTQQMPLMLEQMQLMNQYFPAASVEESLRVLAALSTVTSPASAVPSTTCNPASVLNGPFSGIAGHSKDTYCEMCDKNFCNRYFLRTHKWKKHGIAFAGKNSPTECIAATLAAPSIPQNFALDLPTTSSGVNLSPAEIIAALCNQSAMDVSQISPPRSTLSQPTSVIVNCLSNADSSAAKRTRLNDDENKEEEEASLTCARSENIRIDEESNIANQLPNTDDLFAMIARQAQENAVTRELLSSLKQEGIQPSLQEQSYSCEMCGQECDTRTTLQQHLILQHNILSTLLTPFQLFQPLARLQPQQQQQQMQHQQNNSQAEDVDRSRSSTIVPTMLPSPIAASRQPKKSYSATGKNYCDVCNKEVCNKYFLRTHMLKMHGIVIDEHKTIIANIDTLEKEKSGTIAFRCDICNTNVGQTRESLKQHKQEVHNVVSLPTSRGHRGSLSSNSSITSTSTCRGTAEQSASNHLDSQLRCPLCDVRSAGVPAIQKHLSEKHKMELSVESLESFLKDAYEIKSGQTASALIGSVMENFPQQMTSQTEFTCTQCTEVFNDQIQFQLHMIHTHPLTMPSTEPTQNANLLCAQFNFQSSSVSDSWADSNTKSANDKKENTEEDEALQVTSNDEHHISTTKNLYDCPISCCSRRYRSLTMLNKHIAIIHRWSLKLPFKLGKKNTRDARAFCKRRILSRNDCEKQVLHHFESTSNGDKSTIESKKSGSENGTFDGIEDMNLIPIVEKRGSGCEKEHNSHSQGMSNLNTMREGFGRLSSNNKPYTMQTFVIREQVSQSSTNGTVMREPIFDEMIAHLPVRNMVEEVIRVNVELIPTSKQVSPILHL